MGDNSIEIGLFRLIIIIHRLIAGDHFTPCGVAVLRLIRFVYIIRGILPDDFAAVDLKWGGSGLMKKLYFLFINKYFT